MPFEDHNVNKALDNLKEMEKEIERLLKDFFVSKNPMLMFSENAWAPHVDVYETRNEFIIKVELAGVRKEDIKVQLAGRVLTISGQRQDECPEQREHFHLMEISYGNFLRKLKLPDDIDCDNIQAVYESGILKLVLPKAATISEETVVVTIED